MYHILIVDDEPIVRKGINESINRDNLGIDTIYEADGGRQALSILDNRHVDLIITDIKMPEMDGIAFIQEVRKKHAEIPVIVVSGYSDFNYLQSAIHYGVNDYILKPIRPLDLNSIMETAIDRIEKNSIPLNQEMILKETVLCRMVSGTISKQEVREKLMGSGIAFRKGKYQVIIIRPKEEYTMGRLYQTASLADKLLIRSEQGAAFIHPNGEILAVLCKISDKSNSSDVQNMLRNQIMEKHQILCTMMYGDIVEEIEELPYSYDSARKRRGLPDTETQGREFSKLTQDVVDYIQKHYTENITLRELADCFSVNSSYLGYLFKKETGILFNDYINRCRISYVKDLLKNSTMKIYEIMEKVGILDSHYFTRIFKKYTGMTPSDYRKKQENHTPD